MNPSRVLVVDDEPQIRRVMRTTLTAQGYRVSEARSGEEALEKMWTDKCDLVLLDMNMPGMGAIEACQNRECLTSRTNLKKSPKNALGRQLMLM